MSMPPLLQRWLHARISALWWPQTRGAYRARWLLMPLAKLTAGIAARRQHKASPTPLPVPVICIGNVSVGGNGKTPVVLALARALHERGRRPAVVAHGYYRRNPKPEPLRVDPEADSYHQAGDEALMLARALKSLSVPVYVAARRIDAAKLAAQTCDVVLLDDGLQDSRVHKDLSLLVTAGVSGFGNQCVIPAGPLREPVATALARCDLLVNTIPSQGHALQQTITPALPIVTVSYVCKIPNLQPGTAVLGFSGICQPERFAQTAQRAVEEAQGFWLGFCPFPNHYAYQVRDLQWLVAQLHHRCQQHHRLHSHAVDVASAVLLTTAKDAVRIPEPFANRVHVAQLHLDGLQGWDELLARIESLRPQPNTLQPNTLR